MFSEQEKYWNWQLTRILVFPECCLVGWGSSEIEIVDELFSILDCVSLLGREVKLLTFLFLFS